MKGAGQIPSEMAPSSREVHRRQKQILTRYTNSGEIAQYALRLPIV
jgi:hypothetical protein